MNLGVRNSPAVRMTLSVRGHCSGPPLLCLDAGGAACQARAGAGSFCAPRWFSSTHSTACERVCTPILL